MTKQAEEKTATTAAFENATKPADGVVQEQTDRECKYPVAPRKLTNEDWQYGIGLN